MIKSVCCESIMVRGASIHKIDRHVEIKQSFKFNDGSNLGPGCRSRL